MTRRFFRWHASAKRCSIGMASARLKKPLCAAGTCSGRLTRHATMPQAPAGIPGDRQLRSPNHVQTCDLTSWLSLPSSCQMRTCSAFAFVTRSRLRRGGRPSSSASAALLHCRSDGRCMLLACLPHLRAHDADIQRLITFCQTVAVPHVRLAELHGSQRDELWRHKILRVRKPQPFLCARYTGSMCMCSNKCACSASFDCTHTARISRVSRRASSGGWSTGL